MASTIFPNSNHQPRVHPYSPSNKHSFAFQSVTTRWPKILTQVIDHLVDQNNQLLDQLPSDPDSQSLKAKLTQGKAIISLISELKYEAARDKELSSVLLHSACHIFKKPDWWEDSIESPAHWSLIRIIPNKKIRLFFSTTKNSQNPKRPANRLGFPHLGLLSRPPVKLPSSHTIDAKK
jgi:hypothetical protein